MGESEYMSSPIHFRDLMESPAWIDIKAEMMDMLEEVKNNLITIKDYEEILRFQGRAEVLRDIMLLPKVILGAIEESMEREISDEDLDEPLDDMEV